jgi:uncharacterized membrane protein YqhA
MRGTRAAHKENFRLVTLQYKLTASFIRVLEIHWLEQYINWNSVVCDIKLSKGSHHLATANPIIKLMIY